MIGLVAFFGNVGPKYENNRHNAGFLLASACPFLAPVSWQAKFRAKYAQAEMDGRRVHFLQPATYMNASGESVIECAKFYKIESKDILVVHDELELPFGTVSMKFGGGLGGHNGLRSMNACFGTPDFWRFRIGIGRPDHSDIAAYVLSDFSREERQQFAETISVECASMLERALREGEPALQSMLQKKKLG